ncbi:MAG TPA: methyltransferase domain-containing protein [Bacteroidales bacterium]|nr:methyltransferase domain-containing protein [Bacteroidales bacterium]
MKKYLSNDFDVNGMVDVLDELPLWSAPFGLKLLEFIDYKQHISALDIGFGTGFPLTEVALRLGEGSTVYGIDPWEEAIARVNKKIEHYRIGNIKIIKGVAESIPLDDNSIDLITSNNGINNVSDREKVLGECSRISRKGGQFVQTMNLNKSMFEFYGELERVLSDLQLVNEIEQMHRHIAQKRPPLDILLAMLEKNGFIVKDVEHNLFNYRFSSGTAILNHYFIRMAFMESWIKILPRVRLEEIFDAVESGLNSQAQRAGGINLSIPFVLINAIKK